MRELNNSYKYACLQCSFTDTQRRETGSIPVKRAVSHVGRQDDGMWVLGDDIYISPQGKLVPVEGSKYVWLGSMFRGAGVADESLPLSTNPLRVFLYQMVYARAVFYLRFCLLCIWMGYWRSCQPLVLVATGVGLCGLFLLR